MIEMERQMTTRNGAVKCNVTPVCHTQEVPSSRFHARSGRLRVLRGPHYRIQLVTYPRRPWEGGAWDPRQPQLVVNGSGRDDLG